MTEVEITPTTPEVKPVPTASGSSESSSVFQMTSAPVESNSPSAPQPNLESTTNQNSESTVVTNSSTTTTTTTRPERGVNESLECGGGGPWPETLEAARRRIQLGELISQGQYMEAILQLNHDYANLVATMPSIIFMLRCRYFIELVSGNVFLQLMG